MSMSQEEIEALMSGADDTLFDEVEEEIASDNEENLDSSLDNEEVESKPEIQSKPDIEADTTTTTTTNNNEDPIDVDEILAGIDGIVDDGEEISTSGTSIEDEEVSELENKINNSQYPLPVSDENKVVNQLNEVADDSEEKASKIFDVLSFILDENSEISKYNKNMLDFIVKQSELLGSLSQKFPNVEVFNENLLSAQKLIEISNDLSSKLDGENNKVFEAMELMQYHDINRQKIERVMAVIKKLSSYLNGIFEDESDRAEVQIAKHISGDSSDIVSSDDIESLISEFSKE